MIIKVREQECRCQDEETLQQAPLRWHDPDQVPWVSSQPGQLLGHFPHPLPDTPANCDHHHAPPLKVCQGVQEAGFPASLRKKTSVFLKEVADVSAMGSFLPEITTPPSEARDDEEKMPSDLFPPSSFVTPDY